ncbi:MAG: serine/threonine protein kinase [Bryobacterales bacterium]|nr:serine/threonine protein kinase [Bryobacterales bacterium]
MPADAQSWERLMDVFANALEIGAGPDREAFLEQHLGDDPVLMAEASAMLRAHEDEAPLEIEKKLLQRAGEQDLSGSLVGSYRLIRLIARGGMGEVYAAEREGAPFRQQVALKLLRHGLADMDARVRFRQERQILARLIHPMIVPLLDGGVTADGRPYLVMQHVEGVAITDYCRERKSTIEDRLRLIRDVARAVEHAHRNLVVHRDLKPSNILATADGQARLLDFGVAKMLDPGEDPAPVTRTDVRIMTIDYAAPEQVRGEAITTATDIYGLGILLYELLAGKRPFGDGGTRTAMEHAILDLDPDRPSTVAARVSRLEGRRLRGDLDGIVLKAMAKEPARRYASAEEFARDIERYLAGEPVLAQRPSFTYRLSKFARRNRLASAAILTSVLLLAGSAATVLVQSRRVARERDTARLEQTRANQVVSLLVDLFSTANAEVTPGGRDLTVGQFLNKVESSVVESREADPAVRAQLRHTLGNVYLSRGQYPQAMPHLEAALAEYRRLHGDRDSRTATALHDVGRVLMQTGPRERAAQVMRQSLALQRALNGENHESVAQNMQDLSTQIADQAEARKLLEQSLAIRRSLTNGPTRGLAANLNALGMVSHQQGDMAGAQAYFEESLRNLEASVPSGHPAKQAVLSNLAMIYMRFGDYAKSEQMARTLLVERARTSGEEGHAVGTAWGNLGTILARQGKHAEAEDAFRKSVAILNKVFGPAKSEAANALRNLGMIRVLRGVPREGQQFLGQAAEGYRSTYGEIQGYWFIVGQQAVAKACSGQTVQAELQLQKVVSEIGKAKDKTAAVLTDASVFHAFTLIQNRKPALAETPFRDAVMSRNQRKPVDADSVAAAEAGLGAALAMQGKAEGRDLLRRSLPKFRAWGLAPPCFVEAASKALQDRK